MIESLKQVSWNFPLIAGVVAGVLLIMLLFFPGALLKSLAFVLGHTVFRIRKIGKDYIPNSGPVLLVSNHVSVFDLLVIQSLSHRRVRFLVRQSLLNKLFFLRPFFMCFGVIGVPDGRHPKQMKAFFKRIQNLLKRDEVVCLFPEGGISGNGNLMRFKSSAAPFLPEGVETLVIPVRIGMLHGRVFSLYNGKIRFNRPDRLPIDYSVICGEPVDDGLSAFELRCRISELGAEAEKLPQPGELPVHSAFLYRAKRKPWAKTYLDAQPLTGKNINDFELLVRSIIMSRKIRELDPGKEGYCGVLLPNCVNMTALMMGVLFADRTPAVINFSAGQQVALDSARKAGVKTIFTSRKFIEKLKWEVTPDMVFLEDIAKSVTKAMKYKWILLTLLLPRRILLHNVSPLSCFNTLHQAVLLFSSGSTGKPKGVMLTHRNINCDIWSFRRMLALTTKDKVAGNLPLFHAFGYTVEFAFPAQVGIPVVYVMNPLGAADVLDAIEKFKISVLTATPTFLQRYIHKATAEQLSSLRLVITGAEKLRRELADRFYALTGKEVIEGFGCTELSPIVAVNFNNSIFDMHSRSSKVGSIGSALPGTHVRIVDADTGVELGPGVSGRMQVKGGIVMKGYLNDQAQTNLVIQNGYYDTGDIAKMDSDGFIYITGRASRFSKIGGEMVPHEKIEEEIMRITKSETRDVAVTGKSDAKKGEKIIVFYTDSELDIAALTDKLKESDMPNIWIPKAGDFRHVEALPLLGSGKLDLRKLKELAEELD